MDPIPLSAVRAAVAGATADTAVSVAAAAVAADNAAATSVAAAEADAADTSVGDLYRRTCHVSCDFRVHFVLHCPRSARSGRRFWI